MCGTNISKFGATFHPNNESEKTRRSGRRPMQNSADAKKPNG